MTAKVWGAGRRRRAAKLKKPTTTARALRILARRPLTATALGAELWRCPRCAGTGGLAAFGAADPCFACGGSGKLRRGRVTAATGGGDFAAQMLLGRLRKEGLVRVEPQAGASVWSLTFEGTKAATRAALEGLRGPNRPCDCGGSYPCPHV